MADNINRFFSRFLD